MRVVSGFIVVVLVMWNMSADARPIVVDECAQFDSNVLASDLPLLGEAIEPSAVESSRSQIPDVALLAQLIQVENETYGNGYGDGKPVKEVCAELGTFAGELCKAVDSEIAKLIEIYKKKVADLKEKCESKPFLGWALSCCIKFGEAKLKDWLDGQIKNLREGLCNDLYDLIDPPQPVQPGKPLPIGGGFKRTAFMIGCMNLTCGALPGIITNLCEIKSRELLPVLSIVPPAD